MGIYTFCTNKYEGPNLTELSVANIKHQEYENSTNKYEGK